RWSFYGQADVAVGLSLLAITAFTGLCLFLVWLIFRTGYRIRT
ncbi:MAG: sugar ABC transporter permease, partial [Pseudomonadota bacterium]